MSRIRTIKPDWLDDEPLTALSDAARVLSIALICLADDYGNGRAGRAVLGGRVFPGRPLEILDEALRELVAIRYALTYEVDGQRYFAIRTWSQHQRVDRPGAERVPRPNPELFDEPGEKPPDRGSREIPGIIVVNPGNPRSTHASPSSGSGSGLLSLTAPPDQPEKSGSARGRRKPQAKSEHIPFPMHDGWVPAPEFVAALAESFAVPVARIAATDPEFRYFWKQRKDRRKQAGWERAYRSNVERLAKTGMLYVEAKPPASGSRFQPTGDDAETRRHRRNDLIEDAKIGRYGRDVALRARNPHTDLSRLADELENAPAGSVAKLASGIGRTVP